MRYRCARDEKEMRKRWKRDAQERWEKLPARKTERTRKEGKKETSAQGSRRKTETPGAAGAASCSRYLDTSFFGRQAAGKRGSSAREAAAQGRARPLGRGRRVGDKIPRLPAGLCALALTGCSYAIYGTLIYATLALARARRATGDYGTQGRSLSPLPRAPSVSAPAVDESRIVPPHSMLCHTRRGAAQRKRAMERGKDARGGGAGGEGRGVRWLWRPPISPCAKPRANAG